MTSVTLAHAKLLAGNTPVQRATGRPEAPLRIDAEVIMNAIARLDDLAREAADLRRLIVGAVAFYERPGKA